MNGSACDFTVKIIDGSTARASEVESQVADRHYSPKQEVRHGQVEKQEVGELPRRFHF